MYGLPGAAVGDRIRDEQLHMIVGREAFEVMQIGRDEMNTPHFQCDLLDRRA
jgi:hypothetical protein